MTRSSLLIVLTALMGVGTAPLADAHGKNHRHPHKVVVVKPKYKPVKRVPKVKIYYRHTLPRAASTVVIAGATYAVLDNLYYRRQGDSYVYVEQPPVATIEPVTTETATASSGPAVSGLNPGSLVDLLPEGTTVVTVDGASFYVDGSTWYAPIAGSNQFVVVAPQL
ncbi:DUF6515 family protein [Ferrimonas marina]|uniref:DUF1236 domain-containing protein n=1 Tax=Ferrimonas marina TaxID=299255 RepID=A0A1M5VQJ1_9GAMM|nr:DUF6515 family protein [Ferrimonas marina]SHH77526.1 hypothetical protein SAMN02745129_2923 [Ferrimonas marina]